MLIDLKNSVASILENLQIGPADRLRGLLEVPKSADHGHLALPVFTLAKDLQKNPIEYAKSLAEMLTNESQFTEVKAVGGFVNMSFPPAQIQHYFWKDFDQSNTSNLGFSDSGAGKRVIIDFASPNVAKPMHVGHLRASVIGQAIYRLAQTQGYEVIGVNHLGDWGSQFGKLAFAIDQWSSDKSIDDLGMDGLLALYVKFHEELETQPELEKKGAEYFKRLEDGDKHITQLWKKIIEVSMKEYNRLFGLMGIRHDQVTGESFYNDKLEDVVERLTQKNILSDSEGAKVVFFKDELKFPPCIIKKSDGASIYATRDLATAIYRKEQLKGDLLLYVVGQEQTLHFRQVFEVLKMAGYDWAENAHHIAFGLYRFKEGKMSSRKGKVILFEDLIEQAIHRVKETIAQKNPDLPNKDDVSKKVAMSALIFNDLINERIKNVEFDWERVLSMEGDSGPYISYMAVRCKSILRKFQEDGGVLQPIKDFSDLLVHPAELNLMLQIMRYQDTLAVSFRQFKPNILAQFLLELCSTFGQFYNQCRIKGEDPLLASARAALVMATLKTLEEGLRVIGIEVPEAM